MLYLLLMSLLSLLLQMQYLLLVSLLVWLLEMLYPLLVPLLSLLLEMLHPEPVGVWPGLGKCVGGVRRVWWRAVAVHPEPVGSSWEGWWSGQVGGRVGREGGSAQRGGAAPQGRRP